MTIWIDTNNQLHDDDEGRALSLPSWPQGMSIATPEQLATIAAAQSAQAAAQPNPAAFEQAVKTSLGGIIGANALMVAYPAFMPALQQQDYADLQVLILDAHTKGLLTAAQYASIQAANTQFNLGMALP